MTELNSKNAAWIKRLARAIPFYKHLGITLTELNWGKAEVQLKVTRKLIQSAGFAHGGVTAALIDSAVGLALCTIIDPRDRVTTIELHVNFIAPAKLGLLKTQGQILQRQTNCSRRCRSQRRGWHASLQRICNVHDT